MFSLVTVIVCDHLQKEGLALSVSCEGEAVVSADFDDLDALVGDVLFYFFLEIF